jgi:hypothetical protein
MRLISSLFIFFLLQTSSCFAQTSSNTYWTQAQSSEEKKDFRAAIFCLCMVAEQFIDGNEVAKSFTEHQILTELRRVYSEAGIEERALHLFKTMPTKKVLESERDNAAPESYVKTKANGDLEYFYVPYRFCALGGIKPKLLKVDTPEYRQFLKDCWWYKVSPSATTSTH